MGRDYLVPFLVLQIGLAERGSDPVETASEGSKAAKAKAPAGRALSSKV